MSRAVFHSDRSAFNRKHADLKDMILGHMALDIEVGLKSTAGMPVDTGTMKSATRHFRGPNGGFRVEVDTQYAAYQEAGRRRDGSHVVQHYTTTGTSAGWFQRAVQVVWNNRASIVAEAKTALGLT